VTTTIPTPEDDFASLLGDLLPRDWKDPVGYEVRRSYLEHLAYETGDAFVELILAGIEAHLKDEQWPNGDPAIEDWITALEDLDRGRLYYAASQRRDGAQVLHDALVFWVGEEVAGLVELYVQRLHEMNFRMAEEDKARGRDRAESR
jgi:hypothetical protein